MTFLELIAKIRHDIDDIIKDQGYQNVNFTVESSKPGFGDITCNVGFLLAKQLKQSPYAISKIIASLFQNKPKSEIKGVAAHTTGNLNFEINYEFFNNQVISASLQDDYGKLDIGKNRKLL